MRMPPRIKEPERSAITAAKPADSPRLEEAAKAREEMRLASQRAEQRGGKAHSRKAAAEQTKQQ